MNISLNSLLSANPHVTSYSTFQLNGCELGVVHMPAEHFAGLPLDAFAVSDVNPLYSRVQMADGYGSFGYSVVPGLSGLFLGVNPVARPGKVIAVRPNPSEPSEYDHTQLAAYMSLLVGGQLAFPSLGFITPFGSGDALQSSEAVVRHILTAAVATLGDTSGNNYRQILILSPDEKGIDAFRGLSKDLGTPARSSANIVRPSQEDDEYADELMAYLKPRMGRDGDLPWLIPPHKVISDDPLIMKSRSNHPIEAASLHEPAPGYVRLASNRIIDRASSFIHKKRGSSSLPAAVRIFEGDDDFHQQR